MAREHYRDVLICTPARDGKFHALYVAGILQSTSLNGGWLPMAGQSDIYVARNVLMNTFLQRTEYKTMVFIDSDIGFTAKDLKTLIDSNEDVVSGLYTNKTQPPMPFARGIDGVEVKPEDIPPEGMIQAMFVPGGFLKIERHVLDTIIDKKLVPTYGGGKLHHFYNGRIFEENLLSEDYSFCHLVREAGFQPWLHCGIRLNHDGRTFDAQP